MAFRALSIIPDSNIAGCEYDEEVKTLQIIYQRDSRTYNFFGVPANVAAGFETSGLKADSVYRSTIKGRYPYQEVG